MLNEPAKKSHELDETDLEKVSGGNEEQGVISGGPSPTPRCPNCTSTDIWFDPTEGKMFCGNCLNQWSQE